MASEPSAAEATLDFAEGIWDLRYGSCLDPVEGLPVLGDQAIDVVIADPPYEAEAHTSQRLVARAGGKLRVEPLKFPPITEEERTEAAQQMSRVVRRWIVSAAAGESEGNGGQSTCNTVTREPDQRPSDWVAAALERRSRGGERTGMSGPFGRRWRGSSRC